MRIFGAVTTFVCAFGLASSAMAIDKVEQIETVPVVQTASTDVVEVGVARVMKQLPQMTYKVGDMETPCGYTAASQAKASGASVAYLVEGSSYDCKVSAMNKLAELMKAELASAATVAPSVAGSCYHCPMAAAAMAKQNNTEVKYMVAGIEFDSPEKARTVADQLAAKMKEFGATTASATAPCSKTSTAPCSKTAGSSAPCNKSAQVASASAKSKGCCKDGCAKAAAGGAPCAKSAEAVTASATGGCNKSKDAQHAKDALTAKDAQTASATATSKGCCKDKDKAKAVVASAEKTEPATLTLGCCKKKTGSEAQATEVVSKETEATQVVSNDAEVASEDTPELARAKQMVREIVEFVAAAKNS